MSDLFTDEQKQQIRTEFKLLCHTKVGKSYEDLFCKIMEAVYSDFRKVKPQGQYGDRKNDGYVPSLKKYYQVYAPEDLPSKENTASSKLKEDFEGLLSYWNNDHIKVSEFFYVVNDKYDGVYPTINKAIDELNSIQQDIKIELMRCHNLEKFLMSLDKEIVIDVIKKPYIFQTSSQLVRIEDLREVVDFILRYENVNASEESFPKEVDFDRKMKYNGIEGRIKANFESGIYQHYMIDEYFQSQGAWQKDIIRRKISGWYQEGLRALQEDNKSKSEFIYEFILKKALPEKANYALHSSAYILLSYYFHKCEIFEEPI